MIRLTLSFWVMCLCHCALAQHDSLLVVSYDEAKNKVIRENIRLIASRLDIDVAEAEARQAKLWNNPYFIWNQDMYSVERNEYFNFTNQQLVQVEQVFSIAGKHTNTVKLARINVDMNKLIADDVLRALMLEFTQDYFQLMMLQAKDSLYQRVLTQYQQQIGAAEKMLSVGTIAGNEVIRLKAEMLVIQSEAIANRADMEQTSKRLKTLLNIDSPQTLAVKPKVYKLEQNFTLESLQQEALEARPDLKVRKRAVDYEEMNLRLQRSLSVPDVKFAYQPRDKGSNYVRPYQGFNIEVPLPFFDRNQGRIKSAQIKTEKAGYLEELKNTEVKNEVTASFRQLQQAVQGLTYYDPKFFEETEQLNKNSIFNFTRRNISLLEFLDQQRIYVTTQLQYITMLNQFQQAVSQMNFYIGKEIIP
jgi:cobalt-zinc-cadmium efflux system outer membrane protein